jgi:hypothetical protein
MFSNTKKSCLGCVALFLQLDWQRRESYLSGGKAMLLEKKALSLEDIEAQTALELPDREMMQIVVVIENVLNNNTIEIDVRNNRVAVLVCAVVDLINVIVGPNREDLPLECTIQQPEGS